MIAARLWPVGICPLFSHVGARARSLIAGITEQVLQKCRIDPRRIFIAGLSARGAAVAVMGRSIPTSTQQ
jgi:poly(3-hydroxybutyrate) depolymerase